MEVLHIKRKNNLYIPLISDENLEKAIVEVNDTHRWYSGHRINKIVFEIEKDIPTKIKELREIIIQIIEGKRNFYPCFKKTIYDKSAGKQRDINEPLLWPDQYIHHALIQVLEPVMMRGMDIYCCGSIKGRGIHYGAKAIKKWMKHDIKGTKYCLQLDIRHFYDSIQPQFVMKRMKELIKDGKILTLIEKVLEQGVLIGVYCSQWFANTLLQPLDQLIHQKEYGVSHYLRYMDNFTIFGSNKRQLHRLLNKITQWLSSIGLAVKNDWQIFPVNKRLPVALGYRFGRGHTLIKKRNLLRIKRALSKFRWRRKHHKQITMKQAAGLLSMLGQLRHCNHTKIYVKINIKGVQKQLKDVVRKYMKKQQKNWATIEYSYAENNFKYIEQLVGKDIINTGDIIKIEYVLNKGTI